MRYQLAQAALVSEKDEEKPSSKWNAPRTISSSVRGTNSQKVLLFGDISHN
jgi:hypothetical protein